MKYRLFKGVEISVELLNSPCWFSTSKNTQEEISEISFEFIFLFLRIVFNKVYIKL